MTLTASHPLLGAAFPRSAYSPIDLSTDSPGCVSGELHHFEGLETYVRQHLHTTGASVAYGGYLENRCLYLKSPLFTGEGPSRSIHLGVDVWAPVGTPLYAPLPARVWHAQYNGGILDYGATLILQHEVGSLVFFSLYGHLSLESLRRHAPGDFLEAGALFAEIGPPDENGGWVPHVHVQAITDLQGNQGDFPGVAATADLPHFQSVCPNPMPLLGLDLL